MAGDPGGAPADRVGARLGRRVLPPALRVQVDRAVVDGRQREEVLPAVSLVVGVRVVGVGRVAVEPLVPGGDQLVRGQVLEVRAGLRDPGQQLLPGLVAPAAGLVGELEGHDRRIFVVPQAGIAVEPGQYVLHVGAVAVLDGPGAVEHVVVGRGAVRVVGQAQEPAHVLRHAAVVGPVVHQCEHQPQAKLAGLPDCVVQRIERGVVVHVRLRLQRGVTAAGAVGERPGPDRRQRHCRRVVECAVNHVVRLLVQVVGVGSAEPPRGPAYGELPVPGGHEPARPGRERSPRR